jgi:hypothetical protein
LGAVVPDGSTQHRVADFEGIEHCALRDRTGDFKLDVASDLCQVSQVRREYDSDHIELVAWICSAKILVEM